MEVEFTDDEGRGTGKRIFLDQARIINECFPQVLRDTQGEIDIRFRHFKTSAARWMAYKVLTLTDVPPA